jgi:hypothetical protein
MGTQPGTPIKFPISSFPGATTQEAAGRLYNVYAEPLDDGQVQSAPAPAVWRRSAGLSQYNSIPTGQTGYRGGLIVQNLSYELFTNNLSTIDVTGSVSSLGTVLGTKKVSIARDQANPPHVVIVDIDNGAYSTTGGGPPAPYTGAGNLPQPNSVCFQDGYFFFGIGDSRVFASGINSLTQNTQTFITLQAKSDVIGQRVIAYSGVIWGFTSGHCEIWQDTANPPPGFPYSRNMVLPIGLIQPNAIAGFETGFDAMIWVAQDYGVWYSPVGNFSPNKVSPPDLDRWVENEVRIGNQLEAGCYIIQGKKFWTLTSTGSAITWEFNLITQKWNERGSLSITTGNQTRWRGSAGHPAFNKWLMGDYQTGNMLFPDDTAYDDNGVPQLFRLESGPVDNFPNQIRIARTDFDFVYGVGDVVKNFNMTVLGASSAPGTGLVRLQVNNTSRAITGDQVNVSGIGGTTEANGTFMINVVDGFNIDLRGTTFVHPYTGGGIATDVTQPPNVVNPQVAVSVTKNGGVTWGNPLLRSLGTQQRTQRIRVSVKSAGLSGPMGCRWRLDVTDPVYTAFLKATQATDPRYVGD